MSEGELRMKEDEGKEVESWSDSILGGEGELGWLFL